MKLRKIEDVAKMKNPTKIELKLIERWDFGEWETLMQFVKSLWEYVDCGYWMQQDKTYHLITAGWSGNEDIISALQSNIGFWSQCWESTARGGHYVFKLPEETK